MRQCGVCGNPTEAYITGFFQDISGEYGKLEVVVCSKCTFAMMRALLTKYGVSINVEKPKTSHNG